MKRESVEQAKEVSDQASRTDANVLTFVKKTYWLKGVTAFVSAFIQIKTLRSISLKFGPGRLIVVCNQPCEFWRSKFFFGCWWLLILKISFDLEGNYLIDTGKHTISVRILGINTQVLGANNGTLSDSDQLVSWEEEIDYDGTGQQIKFKFKQEEAYQKGSHVVEILDNGVLLTREGFILD